MKTERSRRIRWTARAGLTCLLLLAFGCRDRDARRSPESSERLVTVGGPITEIVFALGRGESVVGVDTSSVFPVEATRLPKVGYQRTLAAEGILTLRPTRILLSEEAGPPSAIAQLRAAGIKLDVIACPHSLDGARQKIQTIASLLSASQRGAQLLAQLDAEVREAQAVPTSGSRVLFLYARGAGTMHVAGRETQVDEMIRLAGSENAAAAFTGYKPFSAEALLGARADVLLLTQRGAESLGGTDAIFQLPGLAQLPPDRRPRLITQDDLLLLGFGPRLGQAIRELREKLRAPQITAGATSHPAIAVQP